MFLVKSRHTYITLIITFRARTRGQVESEKIIKLNLNKEKDKTKHSLHFYTIFTFFTIFTIIFRVNIILFFLFFIRNFRPSALTTRSRSLFNLRDLCSKSRRCFLFFLYFSFCRDFFFSVSFCFNHVDEIKNLIVIKSMIIFVFFINFVDETKSITLCSLKKSKRRCLNEFTQRQKTSRIFSTIYNFCCAKHATRILL